MNDFCTGCGKPFATEDDRFCAKCGKPREDTPSDPSSDLSSDPDADTGSAPAAAASAEEVSSGQGSAQGSGSKDGPKLGPVLGMVIAFVALPLVIIFGLSDCGSAEGQMQVSGGSRGSWTFVPTGCASMQPYGRMGANLHGQGPNDGAVYVTLDHVQGHKVELEVPGSCRNSDGTNCTVFEIPRDRCTTFDVDLDYTNTTVNDVRLVQGHVALQCTLEDGASVTGRIVFDDC